MPSMPSVPLIKRQAFLGLQRDRLDSGGAHRLGTFTFTHQGQADVGQWCKIAAGAQRPVLADLGCDAGVQQREHRVDHHLAHAAEAHRKGAGAQQHHRSDDLCFDQRSHSGGV